MVKRNNTDYWFYTGNKQCESPGGPLRSVRSVASNNKISLLVEIKVLASAELTSVFQFTFCFALICLDALHMHSVECAV